MKEGQEKGPGDGFEGDAASAGRPPRRRPAAIGGRRPAVSLRAHRARHDDAGGGGLVPALLTCWTRPRREFGTPSRWGRGWAGLCEPPGAARATRVPGSAGDPPPVGCDGGLLSQPAGRAAAALERGVGRRPADPSPCFRAARRRRPSGPVAILWGEMTLAGGGVSSHKRHRPPPASSPAPRCSRRLPWPSNALALVDVWQWTPFMMLAFFAGLQSLPVTPYRAAAVDGATKPAGLPPLDAALDDMPLMAVIGRCRLIDASRRSTR